MSESRQVQYRVVARMFRDGLRLIAEKYYVMKETPAGHWVASRYAPHWLRFEELRKRKHVRWVSKTSIKRHCYPTVEEALNSFKHRKRRQIAHLKLALEEAEFAATAIEAGVDMKALEAEEWGINLGETESFSRYVF